MKKLYFAIVACVLLTLGSTLSAQVYLETGPTTPHEDIIYADGEGYAGATIYAVAPGFPLPSSYVWSATWEGSCDRWYFWPNGTHADVSVYFTSPDQEGGVVRVECEMYNGSTLLGTAFFYLYVYQ